MTLKGSYLLVTIIFLVVSLACGGDTLPEEEQNPTPIPKVNLQEAQVVKVVDGDTIDVLIDGVEYRVRYVLVDTPETKHPTKGVEPFGPEASETNRQLVENKVVGLEKDVSDTDRYGRLLRYVYVGDLMVNEELLRLGLARVATFPPDVKYVDRFLAIQREAQANGVGLWEEETVISTPETTCDCSGNIYNCDDFDTHQAAQACFEHCISVGKGDVHNLDGNNDGLVCTSLPSE